MLISQYKSVQIIAYIIVTYIMSSAKGKLYSPKWCLIITYANLFKYANYLIKYARYKNVPSKNDFCRKNYPRNH